MDSYANSERNQDPVHIENGSQGYTNTVFVHDVTPTTQPRLGSHNDKITFVKGQGTEPKVSLADFGAYCESKEYDPYDYCTSKKPTSYCDTLLHLLKAAVGTGILAIPSSFKDSGYIVGVGGVLFVAFIYAYCMHLFLAAEYELCKRRRVPNMTYANTVHAAFEDCLPKHRWLATTGKFFSNFFFMVYESGGCAIYILFISNNLKQLLDHYLHQEHDLRMVMVYVTIPLILICWIRNLKLLAPFSAIAIFLSVTCFVSVFYYIFQETPSFEGKQAFGNPAKLPVFLTTVVFATAFTGLLLPLKSEMKKPAKLVARTGVLNVAMVPMALLYAVFGLFGYLRYGAGTKGSITLNLPADEKLSQCIKGFYSLSVFICYSLCYYVVFDIVWNNFLKEKVTNYNLLCEYVVRTLIPVATLLMALAIPNLETFISLVGALGISTTSLIIPVAVHTLVFWNQYESNFNFLRFFIRNTVLFLISLIIFVTGIALSVHDVISMYRS